MTYVIIDTRTFNENIDADINLEDIDTSSSLYIPVLDDPVMMEEIVICVKEIKRKKACDRKDNSPEVS